MSDEQLNKIEPTKITNTKALEINKFVHERLGLDMLWNSEDGEKRLLGFTQYGGCMVAIDFEEEKVDKVSVSLNGAPEVCAIQLYMLAKEFDLTPAEPYYESPNGQIFIGDMAYTQRENELKKFIESQKKAKSGLVDVNGNDI